MVTINNISGPHNDKLSHCNVLYDIPLIIRNLLEESSPNYRGFSREILLLHRNYDILIFRYDEAKKAFGFSDAY